MSFRTPRNKTPNSSVRMKTPSTLKHTPKEIARDEEISHQEDALLQDLSDFYKDYNEYQCHKDKITVSTNHLADRSIALVSIASNLSSYQTLLENRAQIASYYLSEPIQNNTLLSKIVLELEKNLELFKIKVNNESNQKQQSALAVQKAELETASNEVLELTRKLDSKEEQLNLLEAQLENEKENLESLQNEEDSKERQDKESLISEKQVAQNAIEERRQKLEAHMNKLDSRRTAVEKSQKELQNLFSEFQKEKEDDMKEWEEIKAKLESTANNSSHIHDLRIKSEEARNEKSDLEEQLYGIIEEISRINRKIEVQKAELSRIDSKHSENQEKIKQLEQKNSELDKLEESLKKRKKDIEETELQFDEEGKTLEQMKNEMKNEEENMSQLEAKVQKTLQKTQEMQITVDKLSFAKSFQLSSLDSCENLATTTSK